MSGSEGGDELVDPVDPDEIVALVADVRAHLQAAQEAGAVYPIAPLPRSLAPPPEARRTPTRAASRAPAVTPRAAPAPASPAASASGPPGTSAQPRPTLPAVRAELGDCRRCKLAGGRTHLVFGVGDPAARLLFVGEGPGQQEDLRGEPFVGAAGELLDRILLNVLRLRREDVYIANVVKCRPPGNRNPEPDEIAACSPFLVAQIEAIRPAVIVALGRFAAQVLLGTDAPLGRLRGQIAERHGAGVVVTYHPAYLLRNPQDKRLTMEDMLVVRRLLKERAGLDLPPVLRGGRERDDADA